MIYGALAVGWVHRNDNPARTTDQTGLKTYSPREALPAWVMRDEIGKVVDSYDTEAKCRADIPGARTDWTCTSERTTAMLADVGWAQYSKITGDRKSTRLNSSHRR